jgi:hypothetical protein
MTSNELILHVNISPTGTNKRAKITLDRSPDQCDSSELLFSKNPDLDWWQLSPIECLQGVPYFGSVT